MRIGSIRKPLWSFVGREASASSAGETRKRTLVPAPKCSFSDSQALLLLSSDRRKQAGPPKHDPIPVSSATASHVQKPRHKRPSAARDRRCTHRTHVLLRAEMAWGEASRQVRLVDLSEGGASITCDNLPEVGSCIELKRQEHVVRARVAWVSEYHCGIEFEDAVDPKTVLRQVPQRSAVSNPNFRRAPLNSKYMSRSDQQANETLPPWWPAPFASCPNTYLKLTSHG